MSHNTWKDCKGGTIVGAFQRFLTALGSDGDRVLSSMSDDRSVLSEELAQFAVTRINNKFTSSGEGYWRKQKVGVRRMKTWNDFFALVRGQSRCVTPLAQGILQKTNFCPCSDREKEVILVLVSKYEIFDAKRAFAITHDDLIGRARGIGLVPCGMETVLNLALDCHNERIWEKIRIATELIGGEYVPILDRFPGGLQCLHLEKMIGYCNDNDLWIFEFNEN